VTAVRVMDSQALMSFGMFYMQLSKGLALSTDAGVRFLCRVIFVIQNVFEAD